MSVQDALRLASRYRDADRILWLLGHKPLTPVQVATASHRLAKIMKGSDASSRQAGLKGMAVPIHRTLPQFGTQAVANTLWSLATLLCRDLPLVQDMYGAASRLIPHFSGRHLSNLTWSMAVLLQPDAPLLSSISLHIGKPAMQDHLSSQSIANTLWSLTVLDVQNLPLTHCFMETVTKSRHPMNSQDVTNMLWAIAPQSTELKREGGWRPFTAAIATCMQGQAADLPVSEIVSIAWAFADAVSPEKGCFRIRGTLLRSFLYGDPTVWGSILGIPYVRKPPNGSMDHRAPPAPTFPKSCIYVPVLHARVWSRPGGWVRCLKNRPRSRSPL